MGNPAGHRVPGAVVMAFPVALAISVAVVLRVAAHAVLTDPPQRGALFGSEFAPGVAVVPGAPVDWRPHYPAGNKSDSPGAGHRSQAAVVASRCNGRWTPFEPTVPGYVWKAGVCGDPLVGDGIGAHMRGGRFYGNGMVTRTYTAGGILPMAVNVVAAHGGYTIIHVCDVAKCGGEVSARCFLDGHCKALERAPEHEAADCGSGRSGRCAPMDTADPRRWYMPCPSTFQLPTVVGGAQRAVYRLPASLTCEHCVLHWHWVTANSCNPPGVRDYYTGPDAPNWTNSCVRDQGGYKPRIPDCGTEIPEEYLACSDIHIKASDNVGSTGAAPTGGTPVADSYGTPAPEAHPYWTPAPQALPYGTPAPQAEEPTVTPPPAAEAAATPAPEYGPLPSPTPAGALRLVVEGRPPTDVATGTAGTVDLAVPACARLTFQALPSAPVPPGSRVLFFLNGDLVWGEGVAPYFLYGNVGDVIDYWPAAKVVYGHAFTLEVVAGAARFSARVRLTRV